MFLQKFSALSNEKHYLHGDLPRMGKNQDVLHPELCSLRKGHLLIVSPLPSALSLLEGTLREHHCHVMCWCSPWLLPDIPPDPAEPALTTSSSSMTFLQPPQGWFCCYWGEQVLLLPLSHCCSSGTFWWDIMPWLLFTAIKLCWQLHKFFPWGILHLLASNRQNLVCFQSILEGFIRHHKHAPKSDTMVSSGKVSNLMET